MKCFKVIEDRRKLSHKLQKTDVTRAKDLANLVSKSHILLKVPRV